MIVFLIILLAVPPTTAQLPPPEPPRMEKYHNDTELHMIFTHLTAAYPKLARMGSIGKSAHGRQLLYIELSTDVNSNASALKPRVRLVANIHGDETVGRELLIYFVQYLLHTSELERTRKILSNQRLFVMPSLNPDGFAASVEGRCETLRGHVGRRNANLVDLNANFPDQFDTPTERRARVHEPETMAMMQWIENTK